MLICNLCFFMDHSDIFGKGSQTSANCFSRFRLVRIWDPYRTLSFLPVVLLISCIHLELESFYLKAKL